jgi:hypothetical protein
MSEYDELIDEALANAKEDREQAKEAFEKMKVIFDIDATKAETLQAVMLIGQNATKLLESQSRSNEQIIKLAQLKQKDKPTGNERTVIDLDELRKNTSA